MKQGKLGPKLSTVLQGQTAPPPFEAPEAIERRLGVKFRLRLGANESPYATPRVPLAAMAEAGKQAGYYGDPECRTLRERLADKHKVPFESIVVAGGIDELLSLFCRAYLNPGDAVITTRGSYPTFEYAANGAGARIERVSYRNLRVDTVALAMNAVEHSAKIVYLANPDNPTGSYVNVRDLSALRAALPTDCLLILDEAYFDYVGQSEAPAVMVDDPNVVHLRTFSKAFGLAGLRVGYSIGHPDHYSGINRIRMHFGVGSISQAAAIASLENSDHVSSVVAATSFGRFKLLEIAGRHGVLAYPSRTNFVLLDFETRERAEAMLQAFLMDGVFLRKPSQPPIDSCIRVTIGTTEDLDGFEESLGRLISA